MKKLIFIILIMILAGVSSFYFLASEISDFYKELPSIPDLNLESLHESQVNSPPPLDVRDGAYSDSTLTIDGVVTWTNMKRSEEGVLPLKKNETLNEMALQKAKEMLDLEYFAHSSPSGKGVSDWADEYNYEYITIGENLAMGNFKSDKDLVEAWMDSPGHRENILNKNYEEIGVGIVRGDFKGDEVWIAVQHFGRPISSCPVPDKTLKVQIDSNNNKIEEMSSELEARKKELENWEGSRRGYNKKVDEYNNLVAEYNKLINNTKKLSQIYNEQVKKFNDCAKEK